MPRIAARFLVLVAVALLAWLALAPEEEAGDASPRSGLRQGGDAGTESAPVRRVGPGVSVGGARSAEPDATDARQLAAGAAGVTAGAGAPGGGGRPSGDDALEAGGSSSRLGRSAPPADAASAEVRVDGEAELDAGPSLAELEAEAALVAERLGLLDPLELEERIDRAVDDSLPPDLLARAREEARRRILADAAIVEDLVRARYGADASPRQLRDARDFGDTLLSAQDDSYRISRLTGIGDRLAY